MRDLERIDKTLDIIRKVWKENPDLRLMQLLMNVLPQSEFLYYIEDDMVAEKVEKFYSHVNNEM